MKYQVRNPGEQHIFYNIKKWIKQGSFYIIYNIGEKVTLVHLMETIGNVNYQVSIVGYCIFEPNYKFLLQLKIY